MNDIYTDISNSTYTARSKLSDSFQLKHQYKQNQSRQLQYDHTDATSYMADKVVYQLCPNCDRKFFQGKLKMHMKSCKPGKILKKKTSKMTDTHNNLRMEIEQPVIKIPSQIIKKSEFKQQLVVNNKISTEENDNQFLNEKLIKQFTLSVKKEHFSEEIFEQKTNINQENITEENVDLVSCKICNRNFMIGRIEKHMKICSKSKKQRPVFDSKIKRINIDDQVPSHQNKQNSKPKTKDIKKLDQNLSVQEKKQQTTKGVQNTKPKWKIDHENFINSIRNMKNIKNGKQTNIPIENPDYVFCKFCERKFAPNTAAIHIPKCQKILHRPKPPQDKKSNTLIKLTEHVKPIYLKEIKSHKVEPPSSQAHPQISSITKSTKVQSTTEFEKSYGLKDPIKTSKNFKVIQKKITTQYANNLGQTNTFAGFVKKYEDVVTRATNYSNIECPHCGRKFSDKAAQRHIPICQQINRFKKPEKKSNAGKRGQSCRLEPIEQFCTHCGFKFSLGHKYCSNCGKKRQALQI